MKRPDKEKKAFVSHASDVLGEIYDAINDLPALKLSELDTEKTALVVVDMINGFVKEGALASSNALAINESVAKLAAAFLEKKMSVAALADTHGADSPEFAAFPVHCLSGSAESSLTDELLVLEGIVRLEKNSTNGFHEAAVREWVEKSGADTFVVTGVCTDLCVMQFAVALKTWFNANNKRSRVIVPTGAVATYDGGTHDSALVGLMAEYIMQTSGVELCSEIEL